MQRAMEQGRAADLAAIAAGVSVKALLPRAERRPPFEPFLPGGARCVALRGERGGVARSTLATIVLRFAVTLPAPARLQKSWSTGEHAVTVFSTRRDDGGPFGRAAAGAAVALWPRAIRPSGGESC